MKFIKWKTLFITGAVCLVPILFGLLLWNYLPESIAIHFDINNNPDNFASKPFVVFGIPFMMLILQIFCCFVNDINAKKYGTRRKFELATKWIIPIMSVILQAVTLIYGLGIKIDIRRVAAIIVAGVFLVIGNYMPKFDYVKNFETDTEKARKINRFIGTLTVGLGILYLISVFLPPVATVVCLILMIPYALICIIYSIAVIRK